MKLVVIGLGSVISLRGQVFFFAEIDFLVVSDRGYRYLSHAFDPMTKYCKMLDLVF